MLGLQNGVQRSILIALLEPTVMTQTSYSMTMKTIQHFIRGRIDYGTWGKYLLAA